LLQPHYRLTADQTLPTERFFLLHLPYSLILRCFKRSCKILLFISTFWLVQCSNPSNVGRGLSEMLYQGLVFGWSSLCENPYSCEGSPKDGLLGLLAR
jgi:hypothetical protein